MASLWKMKMDELRDMAVELGADRKTLYGTSKQAIIIKIHKLQEEAKNNTTTEITDNTDNTDNKEEIIMANTTTAETKNKTQTQNNGWEKIAKRNLKNAYNWNFGGMYNDYQDGNITKEEFDKWVNTTALDEIYYEGITTRYTGDSAGGDAPKEMRFAGKEFCYKYLISLFKKDGYTVAVPEAEPKKKSTKKTTKKAAEPTTVTVVLKAFTGMKIDVYVGTLANNTITITTKAGKEIEFNIDGTQKTQKPGQNPKFNNKIEVVEA